MDVRPRLEEFRRASEALLACPGLSPEISYRIKKILDRVIPIGDSTYLKTVKGAEILSLCTEKLGFVAHQLGADEDLVYRLLTDFEESCEGLLRRCYEFRIKAG